jgi:Transposase DNA-binding/Transposase DDE domain
MEGTVLGVTFGEEQFGAAQLGDRRRTARLVELANRIVNHPGGTLPDKVNAPASLKALYRLMDCKEVTHRSVLESPRQRTLEKMAAAEGTVLVIHDGSELDFTGLKSIATLGQIGNGGNRGYVAHNVLAVVAETREVLGLAYQHLARRPSVKNKETRKQHRDRADRESRWWKTASKQIPAAVPGRLQVEVADRGADVLEFLDFMESSGKYYLVRSKHNRRISLENGAETKLHDFARTLSEGGRRTVEVTATAPRPARTATVAVSWAKVTLLVPLQPRGEIRGVPLTTWVVRVAEIDAPLGVEPLEWILLTNLPVDDLAAANERIDWYKCRWIVEEYHKACKTGCQIEDMQFTTEDRLQPAIALISVVAVSLLQLRDASRHPDAETHQATALFPALLVTVLSLWRYGKRRTDLSVHEFCYALARLGGHQNRKGDHRPGWLVLWRGWTKLQAMAEHASALAGERCG